MKQLFFYSFLFLSLAATAQYNRVKMDSLFYQIDKHNKAMCAVSIMNNTNEIYSNAIGYQNITDNTKASENTLYGIGSISKMFTAVMMYQIFDEKKISPQTTINYFFPFIKNSKDITIAQLLNHSSGIHNFTKDTNYFSYNEKPISENELVAIFNKMPSDFEPGTKHEYSNTNYVLLSLIIEKIGKAPYKKQLQSRILDKIGLKNTFYGFANIPQKSGTNSYSFEEGKWQKEKVTDPSVPRGAGAIVSTPKDLCTFIEHLFAGNLISETSLNSMKKIDDHYGSGIFQFPFFDKTAYGHTGGIDGYESVLMYFEKEHVAYCLIGNGFDIPVNTISIGVLSIYFNKPYTIPSFEKTVTTTTTISNTIFGDYSNTKIGMKISITEKDKKIFAQATNQPALELEKINDTRPLQGKTGK